LVIGVEGLDCFGGGFVLGVGVGGVMGGFGGGCSGVGVCVGWGFVGDGVVVGGRVGGR